MDQEAAEVQAKQLDRSKQFVEVHGWLLPETQGPPEITLNVAMHPMINQRYIHNHNARDG